MISLKLCGLKLIYRCKTDNVSLKTIVQNNFKIKNVSFSNGQLLNEYNQVLCDANPYFIEIHNKHSKPPEGLCNKEYATSKYIMNYSYPSTVIPRGTNCSICNVKGPALHSVTCSDPNKRALLINREGVDYLVKETKNTENQILTILINGGVDITRKEFEEYNIPYHSIQLFGYKIKDYLISEFNSSSILLSYNFETGKTKSSDVSNLSDKKIKVGNVEPFSVRITTHANRELHVTILAQPWHLKNFHKIITRELSEYIYGEPEIYITSASLTTLLEYDFDQLFIKLKYLNTGIVNIKRPKNVASAEDGPYEDDPSEHNKILIEHHDVYYNILCKQGFSHNIYHIYLYKKKVLYNSDQILFDKMPYKYQLTYFSQKGSCNVSVTFGNIPFRYIPKNIELLNYNTNELFVLFQQYSGGVTVNKKDTNNDLYTSMESCVLGRIPPKMNKLTKNDGREMASGTIGKKVNMYNPDKKRFTDDVWILKGNDKSNNFNVILEKDDNVISVPTPYVRFAKLTKDTLCRAEPDSGAECRPKPYSFKNGACPEGIVSMIMPQGVQSSYDARFYPCCRLLDTAFMVDWLMRGFTKSERTMYLIPDRVRTEDNIDTVIDNFTGSLDGALMKGSEIIIKNKGYNGISKHDQKYVIATYIKKGPKTENIDDPAQYIVEVGNIPVIINGVDDLHPIYKEVRNFRGLNVEIPDATDQKEFLNLFIEEEWVWYKNFRAHDAVVNIDDMYSRYSLLTRNNLLNLCTPTEQYYISVLPKGSVYAEIKRINDKCYLVDIYGRGYYIKDLEAYDGSIRGFINYQYSLNDMKHQDIIYRPDLMSKAKRQVYFYTISKDWKMYKSIIELSLGFVVVEIPAVYEKIAKYIKMQYSELSWYDVIIYNNKMMYHLQKIPIREVALKVLDIKDANLLLGFKNGTSIMQEYRFGDYEYGTINVGDYIKCKINCVNGSLKTQSYINIEKIDEKQYNLDIDNERYVKSLLYQIDWSMFENKWNFSKEIFGIPDIIMEDSDNKYNMNYI